MSNHALWDYEWDYDELTQPAKEKTVEDYLAMDYDTLKNHLLQSNDISLVTNSAMKKKLIDSPRKYDFIWFAQDASLEMLSTLLDESGISILSSSSDVADKINALLTSTVAKNILFQMPSFSKLVLEHWDILEYYLYAIDAEGAILFMNYLEEHEKDKRITFFARLNKSAQLEIVKKMTLSKEEAKEFILNGNKEAIEYLLQNHFSITSLNEFSLPQLYSMALKEVSIPNYFLTQTSFIDRISRIGSVKHYRFLINALEKYNDVSEIEEARKKYYEKELTSYDKEERMLNRHLNWYQELSKRMDHQEEILSFMDDYIVPFYGNSSEEYDIRRRLIHFYRENDKQGLKEFLRQESRLQLTNMVIDYHFEEVPYNFFLDLKQLIHFQEGEGRTLSSSEIDTYSKLLVLDDLSYDAVLKLHTGLKEHSMVEEYYDHFRSAKDKQADLIEKAMLTEDSVQKFKDERLSNRAGVPIYILDGEEFYALVKCSHTNKNVPLKGGYHLFMGDGGSFSLDGSNKLKTFIDPKEAYTFIYKSIPKRQIVHTYPVDSASLYSRDLDAATHRVYELLLPEELISKSKSYNEIVLALPNKQKGNDELQSSLEKPELLGIYCYDTITDNDVISAKNLGIGIVLVKTKNYTIDNNNNKMSLTDTHLHGGSQSEYDYLRDINENDMVSRRK